MSQIGSLSRSQDLKTLIAMLDALLPLPVGALVFSTFKRANGLYMGHLEIHERRSLAGKAAMVFS